jgi:hypothetical protein
MTDIVTSDVIHLAKWHENEAVRLRKHPDADMSSAHGLAEMHGETASTLYMLLADRNAAKLQAAEAVVALNNRDRERMQAEREARASEAERDRMKEALELIQVMTFDGGAINTVAINALKEADHD